MTIDEPGYFHQLARVEAGHWWSRSMWRIASDWLESAIGGRRGLDAIDVGCGAGLSLVRLMGLPAIKNVVGLEPDPSALQLARRTRNFEVIKGDAQAMPFEAASFDVVTCFDVLQHLPEAGDRRAASEIARVLKPGGLAVVRSNASGFGPGRSRGGSAYRLGELSEVIASSGLTVRRASYANGIPALGQEVRGRLRFLAGSAGKSWRAHPSGGGLRIEIPSYQVHRWMVRVSSLERWSMTRLGLNLPFGHSTLVLAEKAG